jgi:L-asparaginase II
MGTLAGVAEPEILVDIVRSGFVEGHHRGSVVALNAGGSTAWSVGDVTSPIYPRSCNKPIQALGMLRLGMPLDGELLALAGASHSGEPFHIDGVRRILAVAGLDEGLLQTPADYPLDDDAKDEVVRAGGEKRPIAMNCSGKHAAMLLTASINGWPLESYRDPDHPLQQALATTFSELTGEEIVSTGVDGCGAPLFSSSLTGLARAFGALVQADPGSPERAIVDAFSTHPTYASGTKRDEAALHRAIPGMIGKAGAESCYAVALPDGRAIAMKIDDGSPRARPVVMAAALGRLADVPGDADAIAATGVTPLLGGGQPVGELRATFDSSD